MAKFADRVQGLPVSTKTGVQGHFTLAVVEHASGTLVVRKDEITVEGGERAYPSDPVNARAGQHDLKLTATHISP